MGTTRRSNSYPLKNLATIGWLEQMPSDLVSVVEQLHPDDRAKIQELGYSPIKAAEHFMEVLNQVLMHPDPQALLAAVQKELGRLESQQPEMRPRSTKSRLGKAFGSLLPARSHSNMTDLANTDTFAEIRRSDLELASQFLDDALHVLQAKSLVEGRDRIWDMFADWYQYTGHIFAMSLSMRRLE